MLSDDKLVLLDQIVNLLFGRRFLQYQENG